MQAREERGQAALEQTWIEVVTSLEARRPEIEAAIRARVLDDESIDVSDVEYTEGLGASIPKAFEYGLAGLKAGGRPTGRVPAQLLVQARLAARNGIDFAVVQRRYVDCFHLFEGFMVDEVERQGTAGSGLFKYLRKSTKVLFDELIEAVEAEHSRERTQPTSPEQRRAELVRACLAGKQVGAAELGYELGNFHVGLIGRGEEAADVIKALASELDCLSLVVRPGEGGVWAWLGKRGRPDVDDIHRLLSARWQTGTPLGIGEAGEGREGWRRTHRQAEDAFRLVAGAGGRICRYGEEPLLASVAKDEDAVAWLREAILAPFETARDGGETFRLTLRTYIAAGCNGASAAAALNLARQTVSNRLKAVEEKLGFAVADRVAEIEAALRLHELDA